MKTGIALKMSSFGKERQTRKRETINRVFRAYQNNHHLVVIDFEWAEYNLIPLEIQQILGSLEREVKHEYRVYVTLASRSNDYDTRTELGKRHIRALMHLLEQYNNRFGVCLVVGNRAYLSPQEQKKSLVNSLNALTKFVIQRTDQPVLIGTEGVERTVAELGESYNVIPYFLLTHDLEQKIQSYREIAGDTPRIAVYAPFAFGKDREWTTRALWGYISRRGSTRERLDDSQIQWELIQQGCDAALQSPKGEIVERIMGDAAEALALFNGFECFQDFSQKATKLGITQFIGLPLIDSWEQYARMAEAFNPLPRGDERRPLDR